MANGDERDSGLRDDDDPKMRSRLEQFMPEIVRKTFYAGLGALFTTEEGIRRIATEMKLPKDVANYLIATAGSSKDELFRIIGRELRGFLENVNLSGELTKILTAISFEIKTEIRFIPNSESASGVKPNVKAAVGVKRADGRSDKAERGDKPEKADKADAGSASDEDDALDY